NGGRNQVNCYNPETFRANSARTDSEFSRAFEQIIQSCSHARAYHYFAKSIKKENEFWSCKCVSWKDYRTFCKDSCAHRERFGEYVSPTARGTYFLEIEP
ncbi:Lipase member I, partial [Orchesella cincta]